MYLDPGFGSMIIQFVIAGAAAVGSYFFIMRTKLKSFFKKGKNDDEE